MPKLPLDQTQWGYAIQSFLLQKHRNLSPNIVRVQLLDQTPEGIVFGFVVLTRGVVPFVIRDGDLLPMDLLISVDDAGEIAFQALSERNSFALLGGIPIGDPVATPVKVDDANPPINYAGLPGMYSRGRNATTPAGALFSNTTPVKLASEAIAKARIEDVEVLLKAAADAGIAPQMTERYVEGLREALMVYKKASDENRPTLVVMEPKHDRGFTVEKVAVLTDKGDYELPLKQGIKFAAELFDDQEKAAALVRGDILHWTDRRTEPLYQHNANAGNNTSISEPGLYSVDGMLTKAWKTTYLDGRPCRMLLTAAQDGYDLTASIYGKAWSESHDDEMLKTLYRVSDMRQGSVCFLVNDKTGTATIPFKVITSVVGGGTIDAQVEPLLGQGPVRLTFANVEKAYEVEPGHLMFPNRGYQVYELNGSQNPPRTYAGQSSGLQVSVMRGGGTFKVFEQGRPAYGPITEAKVIFFLTDRYDLSPEAVGQLMDQVRKIGRVDFVGRAKEERENPAFLAAEKVAALNLAMDLHSLEVKIASQPGWLQSANDLMLGLLVKSAAPTPNPADTQSGPNRPESDNPAESGVGAPGMGAPGVQSDPMAAIPNGAEPAGVQDVADLLTAYAMGQMAPEELSTLYSDLSAKLTEAENMVGKILLLVQMRKADFITYNEVKRVLDEMDKFRATLLNAGMLQASTATSIPAGAPIAQ